MVCHSGKIGGAEVALAEIVGSLPFHCEVVIMGTGPLVAELSDRGVTVHHMKASRLVTGSAYEVRFIGRLLGCLTYGALVARILRRLRGFTCIYVNSHNVLAPCGIASLISRKPLVWHQHIVVDANSSMALSLRDKLSRWLLVKMGNLFASRVICVSASAREAYIRSGGNVNKAVIVRNGVSPIGRTCGTDFDAYALRHELGVADVPLVGVFGRLQKRKGQDLAIRMLAGLESAHCLLVGGAAFSDPHFVEELRKLAESLGVSRRVHFLGHRDDVPILMAITDVVLQPQREPESFGLVTVEAMVAGKPVVATRLGGSEEILEHNVTGLLVEPGDISAMTDAVKSLLGDKMLRESIAERAQHIALERYSVDRWSDEIADELRDMVLSSARWRSQK